MHKSAPRSADSAAYVGDRADVTTIRDRRAIRQALPEQAVLGAQALASLLELRDRVERRLAGDETSAHSDDAVVPDGIGPAALPAEVS